MTPTNPITEAREALDHIHTWEEDLDFREQRKAITAALDYAETQAIEIGRLKADRNDWHDNYQSLAVRFEEQRDDLTSIKAKLAKAEKVIADIPTLKEIIREHFYAAPFDGCTERLAVVLSRHIQGLPLRTPEEEEALRVSNLNAEDRKAYWIERNRAASLIEKLEGMG